MTGIGGFIGAHCLDYFLEKTDWFIVGLDSFRHKGTYSRLAEVVRKHFKPTETTGASGSLEICWNWSDRLAIHNHDISVPIDEQLERKIGHVDYIINMASDSAVERSVTDPVACLRNNYDLTINMLEYARRIKPEIFFQISTDEVYGEAKPGQSHKEWDVIMPSNPYAASKAAQEAVAIAYWRSYDVPVVLTNTMNNIGEMQDPEKFLPKIIRKVQSGEEMPIYGDSFESIGTRFYLHAKNHADALVFLSKQPVARYSQGAERPDRYNVCGDVELNNLDLAQMVADIMGKPLMYRLVPSESARKGYDKRYALDGTKLRDLGWTPPISFRESLERIVAWTQAQNWF